MSGGGAKKKVSNRQNNNTLEDYDPSINDATPIQFGGYDLFCDEPNAVLTDLYSIKNKNFPQYWNNIITEIQEAEHTGIIKKQCSNKTEVEKIKSIIKFIKVISSRIDYE